MAANLYLGPPNSTYWTSPHPAEYNNTAIWHTPDELIAKKPNQVFIRINNSGDAPVEDALVRLYWTDPGTTYLPTRCCLIKEFPLQHVDRLTHTTEGAPTDISCWWTPNACTLGTSAGSIALVAQVSSDSIPQFPAGSPETDPRTAIHNVHVVETAPLVAAPLVAPRSFSIATPTREHPKSLHFAFAATNPTGKVLVSSITAKSVNSPEKSHVLCSALASPKLRRLSCRDRPDNTDAKIAHLHFGVERVVARHVETRRKGGSEFIYQGARIGHSGPLTPMDFDNLVFDSCEETPEKFELRPYESRQIILGVVPQGKPGDVHVIEIVHRDFETKKRVGGLVVVAVVGRGFTND